MRKVIVLLAVILSLLACSSNDTPVRQTASTTNYYIDSLSGNDDNDGTTSSHPWKTFANLATTSFSINSTIYLYRGGTWNEQLTVPASDLNIDAYGTGALPIIDGSIAISGWTNLGGGIYSRTATVATGEGLGNLSEEGVMMTFVAWDDNYPTSFTGASNGSYTFNWATNSLYIKTASDPVTKNYRASLKLFGITAEDESNIAVKNISVTRFSLVGINFKNCANCTVSDSTISKGGGAVLGATQSGSPDYLYAGNGIEYGNSSTDGSVSHATISEIFDSGLSPQTYASNQTAGPYTFDSVTISDCGFAGVEISVLDNGGATNSSIDTVTMSNITVTNSGKGWSGQRYGTEGYGIRIKADAGAGSISNVSLNTSVITGSINSGIKLAGESNIVTLSRSKFHHNTSHGVEVAETNATSLRLDVSSSLIYNNAGNGISYNSTSAAGFNVLHNTFYNNNSINLAIYNQTGTAVIKNNLFHSSAVMTHVYVSGTLTGATFDFNCYQDQTNMFGYAGSAYLSVAAFNIAHSPFETNGTGSGIIGMTDPDSADFSIPMGSSCDNLGDATVGVTTDYAGNSFANPPASGAYEAQ